MPLGEIRLERCICIEWHGKEASETFAKCFEKNVDLSFLLPLLALYLLLDFSSFYSSSSFMATKFREEGGLGKLHEH